MSWDMNRVTLIGRLTRDVELRYTSSGVPIAKFGLAVGGRKDDEVSFFNIVAFNKSAENCDKYIGKGKMVAIDGRLQQSRWDAQDGSKQSRIEIVAERVQFLSPANSGGDQQSYNQNQSTNKPPTQNQQTNQYQEYYSRLLQLPPNHQNQKKLLLMVLVYFPQKQPMQQ